MNPLRKPLLLKALSELDHLLPKPVDLLVGGGGAMILAYSETELTADFDAVPLKSTLTFSEIQPLALKVAELLGLSKDWINPHFGGFTHVLPADFRKREREVFSGKNLRCIALGPEDLLVMKLMAGRKKDDRHIRRLLKLRTIQLAIVETHLEALIEKKIPRAEAALDLLDEFKESLGVE